LEQQNNATATELAGTLVTTVTLRSRGGGGGLRSREEPTYLVGAAAVVFVSDGRSGSHVAGGVGYQWSRWRGEGAPAGEQGGSDLAQRPS